MINIQNKLNNKKKVEVGSIAAEKDDLFGDDEPEVPKAPVAPKPVKEQKKKPAAKSIVSFDIKIYD
jgi:hypothetical protein